MTAVMTPTFPLNQLASLRRAKRLTQEQLGRMTGIKPETISIIERASQPGDAIDRLINAVVSAPEPEATAVQ